MVASRLVASGLVRCRPRGCSSAPGLHQHYGTRTTGHHGPSCTRAVGWQGPYCSGTGGLRGHPYSTGPGIEDKLEKYCSMAPTPLSIAEFIERGRPGLMSEAASYDHLVQEVLVRISHLITEIRQFPSELPEQEEYSKVVEDYMQTYTEALSFENRKSTPENILEAVEMLKAAKVRHTGVVPSMAAACRAMRLKYGLSAEEVGRHHGLTRAVQYCLDRLYLHRISLNMLTKQHLMVYGHVKTVEDQVGVIHPDTDVEAVVRHAYQNARMLCEKCYLTAPELEIRSHNVTCPNNRVSVVHIPSHIYHMAFEVMKNAMQVTVDNNYGDLEKLPPIKVLVCQSDMDITIKVSDQGGGVDRVTADKMFKYLFTTPPSPSLTSESVPLSGFGYGLPLSRLYARYFQGDIRAASYENHGTDIYIYVQALAKESVEKLPIWSETASSKMNVENVFITDDWTDPNITHMDLGLQNESGAPCKLSVH